MAILNLLFSSKKNKNKTVPELDTAQPQLVYLFLLWKQEEMKNSDNIANDTFPNGLQ